MAYRAATFVISVHRMKVGCAKEKDMEKFKACGKRYKATIQEKQNGEVTDEITGVREIPEHSVPHPKKIQNALYQAVHNQSLLQREQLQQASFS